MKFRHGLIDVPLILQRQPEIVMDGRTIRLNRQRGTELVNGVTQPGAMLL